MQSDLCVPEDSLATRMYCVHIFPSVAIFLFEYIYGVVLTTRYSLPKRRVRQDLVFKYKEWASFICQGHNGLKYKNKIQLDQRYINQ
jgi:hypothetical protein